MTDPTRYGLWRKPDKKMMWLIVQVRSNSKLELNYHDRSNKMLSIMKSRNDNYVIDRIGMIFVKYFTDMLRPIRKCAVYDEDEAGQWRDWSYTSTLRQTQNWTVMTKLTEYGQWLRPNKTTMWLII